MKTPMRFYGFRGLEASHKPEHTTDGQEHPVVASGDDAGLGAGAVVAGLKSLGSRTHSFILESGVVELNPSSAGFLLLEKQADDIAFIPMPVRSSPAGTGILVHMKPIHKVALAAVLRPAKQFILKE